MATNALFPIGTRVVAVSHNEGKTLFVFGRGVFEGYFLPPQIDLPKAVAEIQAEYAIQRSVTPGLPEVFPEDHAKTALLLTMAEPRIKLDKTVGGDPLDATVWGHECWWSDEPTFEEKAAGYTLVDANIEEIREANKKLAAMEEDFRSAILGAEEAKQN